MIEQWFRLAAFPETVFCRQDLLFEETGTLAGLPARTILLDEDIEFSARNGDFDTSGPVTYI